VENGDNKNSESQVAPDEIFGRASGVKALPTVLTSGKAQSDEARCKETFVSRFIVLCQHVISEAGGELKAFIHYRRILWS
jgi:hypothetical protein